MSSIYTVIIVVIVFIIVLLGIGWLGFQIEPDSFSPHPDSTQDAGAVELPPNLPEPVQRYYEAAMGTHVPMIDSAVVWGKAKLKISGIWMPVRFKTYYLPGRGYLSVLFKQ